VNQNPRPCLILLPLFLAFAMPGSAEPPVRLMTLDPGHFHAALIQKEMYPGVSPTVHVYAPVGGDLVAHLGRIAAYNQRGERPTAWALEVHAGPDFLPRMLREKPGNVVVISGRNRGKIDRILASVEAGLNVLADKPWLIDEADLPKLKRALDTAEAKGLVAYDVMTERYEITTILQGELARDPEIAGALPPGTPEAPALYIDSVHHLMKTVSGAPLVRPAWFFDTEEQGEALADVGTHLVDLASSVFFPGQALAETDTHLLAAKRWPTVLSREQLLRVIGEKAPPPVLQARMKDGKLDYYCNTQVDYTLRGRHVRLDVRWDYEAPPGGGDTHFAVVRGSQARIEVRQGAEQKWRTELYAVPLKPADRAAVKAAVEKKVAALASRYPGLSVVDEGEAVRIQIPDVFRTGHEAHFAEVTTRFLEYLKTPGSIPAWEKANMLAKYSITTRGAALSLRGAAR
jgi:predicted dehydrogenase